MCILILVEFHSLKFKIQVTVPMEGKKPYILLIGALDKASYVTVMLAAVRRSSRKA